MSILRIALCLALLPTLLRAGELRLEFEHRVGGQPLILGAKHSLGGVELSFSRVDYLLSGFALKTEAGDWIEAGESLVGFVGEAKGLRTVDLGNVPDGRYTALRFDVGPTPQQNASDPNSHAPGHALHPLHCGLHWGWQGGYIFIALEGHLEKGGFAYHLAEDVNRTRVELPLDVDLGKRSTVGIRFDVSKLFLGDSGLRPADGEVSTHSRAGDPLPAKMRKTLGGAFSFAWERPEAFHALPASDATQHGNVGTPYPLRVSRRLPAFELPADNPLTVEGIALGRRLFEDPILSRDGSISCMTCHQQQRAFTDGLVTSAGIGGAQGRRNSMPLANLIWGQEFFWDGHAPDLRKQVLEPIEAPEEMGESLSRVVRKLIEAEGYPEAFQSAFGARAVTPDRIAKALEQFLLSLVSQDSRFDQAMRGELEFTEQEKRGFELFVMEKDPKLGLHGADCFHCHGGSLFGGAGYFDNGLGVDAEDAGRFEVTGRESDRGLFKAPSLRNVELTAPYMHDGRFETLEEVVAHYDSGIVRTPNLDPNIAKHPEAGLELSDKDKAALVAFLKTLTDQGFVTP